MSESEHVIGEMGGNIDRLRISLRFVGSDLDPAVVTQALAIEPTFAARKGQIVHRGATQHTQPTGVWYLALPDSTEWEISDAIRTLLDKVPVPPAAIREVASRYYGEVFCGLFLEQYNRGCTLEPDVLEALAERRLALGFDIYANGGE